MLQAMRLETMGFYVEDGNQVYVGPNDVKRYVDHFILEAKIEARRLLGSVTSNIKIEVDEL